VLENIAQYMVSGTLVGVSYGVLAAGLALIFGVMKIINFAHAEFVVLAMYFPTYWFLQWWGVDPFISSIIAFPMYFFLGYIVQQLVIERIFSTGKTMLEAETSTLVITMGLSMLNANMILI
jgi:branched-chain amino acid transport system permease protein